MTEETPAKQGEPTSKEEYKVGNKKPPKEYQWKPGQSGNPAGRKPMSLISILKAELAKIPEEMKSQPKEKQLEWQRLVIRQWLKNAGVKGDQRAIDSMVAHIDGKPKESIEIEGGNINIKHEFIFEKESK